MNARTMVVATFAFAVAVAPGVSAPALADSVVNHLPVLSRNGITNRIPGASLDSITNDFVPAPPLPPSPASSCASASVGPAVAGCIAIAGITPEVQALNRLACLLEGIERWKLSTIACAQRQVDEWQATVIWPRTVLDSLRTASLARVKTLREQYEEMVEDWSHPAATQSLASIYGAPKIVVRSEYEAVWGASRGPGRDIGDVASWLSVTNRNTIQGRTSAAFGLAGELPESTWERIGREGSRVLADSKRDPLSALRHTPQMLTDRARVESNTLRMQAQTLATRQFQRDFRRYQRRREQVLARLWLRLLAGGEAHRTPPLGTRS